MVNDRCLQFDFLFFLVFKGFTFSWLSSLLVSLTPDCIVQSRPTTQAMMIRKAFVDQG